MTGVPASPDALREILTFWPSGYRTTHPKIEGDCVRGVERQFGSAELWAVTIILRRPFFTGQMRVGISIES